MGNLLIERVKELEREIAKIAVASHAYFACRRPEPREVMFRLFHLDHKVRRIGFLFAEDDRMIRGTPLLYQMQEASTFGLSQPTPRPADRRGVE